MKEDSHKLLEEATTDEILSCIQLLAISVVQHRAKCGFVTLRNSTEQLRPTADEAEATGLFLQSKQVLEEALEMVRILAAESAKTLETHNVPDTSSAESRTQFRIKIALPIKVLWPQDTKPVNARLYDISWGGASFHVDRGKAWLG